MVTGSTESVPEMISAGRVPWEMLHGPGLEAGVGGPPKWNLCHLHSFMGVM